MFPGRIRHSIRCPLPGLLGLAILFWAVVGTAFGEDASQNFAAFKTPETAQTIRLNQLANTDTARMGFRELEPPPTP